jgi:hypothetical protein
VVVVAEGLEAVKARVAVAMEEVEVMAQEHREKVVEVALAAAVMAQECSGRVVVVVLAVETAEMRVKVAGGERALPLVKAEVETNVCGASAAHQPVLHDDGLLDAAAGVVQLHNAAKAR